MRQLDLVAALLLVLVTAALFWPVTGFDFINSDDNLYITENRVVQDGLSWQGVVWAFSSMEAANWHPLTWLSHMLDVELFGLNAGGHHLMSLVLHLLNTVLLLFFLIRTTGARWPSIFTALLFATHPLHVESVAWVAERKGILSTFFWILACQAYATYARQPALGRYLVVVFIFIAGLAAKPMLVTLPFVLLLLDYWPLERVPGPSLRDSKKRYPALSLQSALLEKIPLLLITTAACVVTWMAQAGGGSIKALDVVPLSVRATNAVNAYATYLFDTIWPMSLAALYPLTNTIQWERFLLSLLLVLSITSVVLIYAKRYRYAFTGWLWYLGTLVPVIGFVQVGAQAHADRYTYVPLIGVFIMITWGGAELLRRWRRPWRIFGLAVAVGWLGILFYQTHVHLPTWRNSILLLNQTLAVTEKNYFAHSNLGMALLDAGQAEAAAVQFHQALKWNPSYAKAINNLGVAYERLGRLEAAIDQYRAALRVQPDYTVARYNLGNLYMQRGELVEALVHYRLALRSNPKDPDILVNLGLALYQGGDTEMAVQRLREALDLNPGDSGILNNLGVVMYASGDATGAWEIFKQILTAAPDNTMALYNLGFICEKQGRLAEAAGYYDLVLRIQPENPKALSGRQRIQMKRP